MKERPILFSAQMVRAILDGRKTQTRRLFNPERFRVRLGRRVSSDLPAFVEPPIVAEPGHYWASMNPHGAVSIDVAGKRLGVKPGEFHLVCPYAEGETRLEGDTWRMETPGSRLWVKETHQIFTIGDSTGVAYRATCAPDGSFNYVDGDEVVNIKPASWRPSIHMRRAWSRITLGVDRVRLERLQSAKLGDLRAEGMSAADYEKCLASFTGAEYQREWWRTLWDSINGERAPYASNPWVWVIEFYRDHSAAVAA